MTTAPEPEVEGQSPAAPAPAPSPANGGEIVARAGRYYRNARYLMALICVGLGLWFAYDGWVGWPNENMKRAEVSAKLETARATGDKETESKLQEELKSLKERSNFDITLQRLLGASLPLAGVALLCWALYNSRGTYRFADNTLYAPGHPPVPVDAVREIDKEKWDRKGIAYIAYEVPGGAGRIKIDDFVYEQAPMQAILARVESLVAPEAPNAPDATEAPDRQETEETPTV